MALCCRTPVPPLSDIAANLPGVLAGFGKILLPVSLSPISDVADLSAIPGLLTALATLACVRLVPGVRMRIVALGAAVFILFLIPVLAAAGSLVLDQRLVLPAVGALGIAAEIVRALAVEWRVKVAFAGVTIALLAALTVVYEGVFRDRRAFAHEAVAGAPRSPLAHVCLGHSYQLDGDDDRALSEYRTALMLGTSEVVHNNIAVISMARGRWGEAERELRSELAINPRYSTAYGNLGIVLRQEGRTDEACAAIRRTGELAPGPAAGPTLPADPTPPDCQR